ncbi:MAG: hypothetical protein AAF825_00245 [Pseudomonadota bacterium]
MMRRRDLLLGLLATASSVGLAEAQTPVDAIIARLESEGWRLTRQTRTLLGRVRIIARKGSDQREVVIDPRNGAILRDFIYQDALSGNGGTGAGTRSSGEDESTGSHGSSDNDGDDDNDDDDDGGDDDGGDEHDDD